MPLRPLALACALAAAAGCGKSKAEEIFEEERRLCLGFPAAGTTMSGAAQTFGNATAEGFTRCLPGIDSGAPGEKLVRIPGDVCDHTGTICEYGWCYYPNDSALCGPNGCWYGCGVRVVPRDNGAGGTVIDGESVICASRFESEQPFPPVCPF